MENQPTSKSRKIIVIAIIILVVLILATLVIDTFFGNSYVLKTSGYQGRYLCKMTTSSKFQEPYLQNCYHSWQCKQLDNDIFKDQCYSQFAIEEKNSKLCNKIKTEFIKKSCIENANK